MAPCWSALTIFDAAPIAEALSWTCPWTPQETLQRPRVHTQIAERRFHSANHLVSFHQPDLIAVNGGLGSNGLVTGIGIERGRRAGYHEPWFSFRIAAIAFRPGAAAGRRRKCRSAVSRSKLLT
jgi:hypothetical protein